MIDRADLDKYRYVAGQNFFAVDAVKDLIGQIAREEDICVFLGAGGSVAQGLPTWNELLLRMLTHAVKGDGRFDNDEQRDTWARTVLRNYDATAAASVLRARFNQPRTFASKLYEAMYKGLDIANMRERKADRFSSAVWSLIIQRLESGKRTTLATLNFDDTIERAFKGSPGIAAAGAAVGIKDVVPVWSAERAREVSGEAGAFPVFHLHGYLPRDNWSEAGSPNFILSAADFANSWREHWSYEVLEREFSKQWVMAGMSFQDSHVNSILHRRAESGLGGDKHPVGVLSTQGRPWFDLPPSTTELLAEAEQTRLAELGLIGLITSYFFQDQVFLQEIGRHSRDHDAMPYADVLGRWHSDLDGLKVPGRQSKLRKELRKLREDVEAMSPPAGANEKLKAELWVRNPTDRTIVLWASSELKIEESNRAPSFPLASNSSVAAVKALTHGAVRTHDRGGTPTGAWRSFVAHPIFLGDGDWPELPVASLVLASSVALDQSMLDREAPDVAERVHLAVPRLTSLLTPSPFTRLASRVIPG